MWLKLQRPSLYKKLQSLLLFHLLHLKRKILLHHHLPRKRNLQKKSLKNRMFLDQLEVVNLSMLLDQLVLILHQQKLQLIKAKRKTKNLRKPLKKLQKRPQNRSHRYHLLNLKLQFKVNKLKSKIKLKIKLKMSWKNKIIKSKEIRILNRIKMFKKKVH